MRMRESNQVKITAWTCQRHCETVSGTGLIKVYDYPFSPGAGGEKKAEALDHKWVPEHTAVVVLAILVCLFLLAALGYSVKWLLKRRQR